VLDLIEQEIKTAQDAETRIHLTREFLQSIILKIIYDKNYFKNIAFVGGTALRFLYGLRRFSEHLDFSLVDRNGYRFERFLNEITYELQKYGFSIEVKKAKEKTFHSFFIEFTDVLYPLGLSRQREQKLSIKVEIDSNPPDGFNTELSLVNRHFVFTVLHFDIASLYATKIHACFFRKYTKGRDFYDFLWYLSKNITPNFKLLNKAIEQTEKKKVNLSQNNFKDFLKEKLSKIDFVKVRKDLEPFIEDKSELKLLERDLIINLLK